MRSRAAAARLPSSSTNSCKSDTSRHNSLGWELRCRRRRRRRLAAPRLGNTHHTFVSQSKQKIIYARMRHCVASGRRGARQHCWSTLAITHGKFGLLCGILQPWHAPSHLNEIIAQLPHCCTVLHYITVLLLLPHSHRRAVSPRPPIYNYDNNKSSLWITGPFLTARFLLMLTEVSDLFSFGQKDRRAVAQCRVD